MPCKGLEIWIVPGKFPSGLEPKQTLYKYACCSAGLDCQVWVKFGRDALLTACQIVPKQVCVHEGSGLLTEFFGLRFATAMSVQLMHTGNRQCK